MTITLSLMMGKGKFTGPNIGHRTVKLGLIPDTIQLTWAFASLDAILGFLTGN